MGGNITVPSTGGSPSGPGGGPPITPNPSNPLTSTTTLLVNSENEVDCSSAGVILAMPVSPVAGNIVIVKRVDASYNSANAVTLQYLASGEQNTLTMQYQSRTLFFNGTAWVNT